MSGSVYSLKLVKLKSSSGLRVKSEMKATNEKIEMLKIKLRKINGSWFKRSIRRKSLDEVFEKTSQSEFSVGTSSLSQV